MSDLNMPKPAEEAKKVISPEKSYSNINAKLMEMAGMGKISATTYMITIFNSYNCRENSHQIAYMQL